MHFSNRPVDVQINRARPHAFAKCLRRRYEPSTGKYSPRALSTRGHWTPPRAITVFIDAINNAHRVRILYVIPKRNVLHNDCCFKYLVRDRWNSSVLNRSETVNSFGAVREKTRTRRGLMYGYGCNYVGRI